MKEQGGDYSFSFGVKAWNKQKGFTLIEIMVAVAIVAILTAVAVPNVRSWMANYRLKADARGLYADMHQARLEAVNRKANVIFTFTPAVAPCTLNGGGSYLFFADDGAGANAGNNVQDADEPTFLAGAFDDGVCLAASTFAVGGGFNSRGLRSGATGTVSLTHAGLSRTFTLSQTMAAGIRIN